jgi:serine/threonine protein phosphatase 1
MVKGRTYAIGDVHGCLGQLKRLLRQCFKDNNDEKPRLILLGDYIDRGPDSRGVVEFLMAAQSCMGERLTCLLGNHEALALYSVAHRADIEAWIHNGGGATLRSYGVASIADIPIDHIVWLRSLPIHRDDGLRFFVHAGVNPGKPLDRQADVDLLWIREPFLSDRRIYPRFIVHGHTPTLTRTPDQQVNRVNIDTGAYLGGPLTAAVFDCVQAKPIAFLKED